MLYNCSCQPASEDIQEQGGSLIMLAKGNRSKAVTDSCKKYGGFYLGSIGGPAARLGRDCITAVETREYPELGMEAIFLITVKMIRETTSSKIC